MKFRIVELEKLSGNRTKIYSIILDGEEETLFDKFIKDNKEYKEEVNNIISRLLVISNDTGARDHFFKTHEGVPGDGVDALYDEDDKRLRLYCIRYAKIAIILGNGGEKNKNVISWQDDLRLSQIVPELMKISKIIAESDTKINDNGEFEGDIEFDNYENI